MNCEKLRIGSSQVHAYVQTYKNTPKVHIRNFKPVGGGKWIPTVKGVAFDLNEWEMFKSLVRVIDSEINNQLCSSLKVEFGSLE